MAYYSSETCEPDDVEANNSSKIESGCKNDYESSEIKYVVDA